MQYIKRIADDQHLCLLTNEEYDFVLWQSRSSKGQVTPGTEIEFVKWRREFLRDLKILGLDTYTYNAIGRSIDRHPDSFQDTDGHLMSLRSWCVAVLNGEKQVVGVGRERTKKLLPALIEYVGALTTV